MSDWNKHLSKLCHTCRTVKPLRSSHCRCCNRCVMAYDHHCPYVQTCIGFKNRPWFFAFVSLMFLHQMITLRVIYVYLYMTGFDQYIFYPGTVIVLFFAIMVGILTLSCVSNIFTNPFV